MFEKSIGDLVADQMLSNLNSDFYKNTFSSSSVKIAKKKDDEEEKEEKEEKDEKEEEKDEKKEEKKEDKKSKKASFNAAVTGLDKLAEILDDLGLEKSAYAATRTLEILVSEADGMGSAFYADDKDEMNADDENDAAVTHDHPHTHSSENPEACHTHKDMDLADDSYEYSKEDEQILKELEEAFGGPGKLDELVEGGISFDENEANEDYEVGPDPAESSGLSAAQLLEGVELPGPSVEEEAAKEPVDERVSEPGLPVFLQDETIAEHVKGQPEEVKHAIIDLIEDLGLDRGQQLLAAPRLVKFVELLQGKPSVEEKVAVVRVFGKMIKNAKVKARNRPSPVFDSKHPKVKDNKDHFPLGTENQARNALARASQFKDAPEWYSGSLKELVNAVSKAVHSKYPGIKISEKGKTPKKGFQDVDNMLTVTAKKLTVSTEDVLNAFK